MSFSPVFLLLACCLAAAMAVVPKTVTLNNGLRMPAIIYGSGGAVTQANVSATATAVALAVSSSVGFPGIDCASNYHNQVGVAQGIAASGTKRNEIWLQSKIPPCGHSIVRDGHCFEDSLRAFDQNLKELATEYIDLMLIHSPPCVPNSSWADPECVWKDPLDEDNYPQHCNCDAAEPCKMMQDQWRALEQRLAEGKTKAIGVSNFCVPCLECLAKVSSTIPAVNQLQFHPGMAGGTDPMGLLSYTMAHGIQVQAYSPLGGEQASAVLGSPVLKAVGAAHNKSSAKVALQWVIKIGYALATASFSKSHMVDDMDLFEWEMTPDEISRVAAVGEIAPDDPAKQMCLYKAQSIV